MELDFADENTVDSKLLDIILQRNRLSFILIVSFNKYCDSIENTPIWGGQLEVITIITINTGEVES